MSKEEAIEKIRKGIHDCCKIIAFLQIDDETYEVGEDLDVATKQFSEALTELEKQPEPTRLKIRAKAEADVFLQDTEKLDEKKLKELLASDWNGVGFIMRVYGELLEGRLMAKTILELLEKQPEPTETSHNLRRIAGYEYMREPQRKTDKEDILEAAKALDRQAAENKRLKEELSKWENMTAEELGEMIAGM